MALFGSYANGCPHEESDIDIAVFVSGLDEETWYNARIMLQKIRRKRGYLDIEPHLLDETYYPSGFAEYVNKTGEVIYSMGAKTASDNPLELFSSDKSNTCML